MLFKIHQIKCREFYKHKKSEKWNNLNEEYKQKLKKSKESYYKNMVEDLKISKPALWYSKVKRMGALLDKDEEIFVEELLGIKSDQQANQIADFYASTRNLFQPLNPNDFQDYMNQDQYEDLSTLLIEPRKIMEIVKNMNRKSASVNGDLPMKLVTEFAMELSLPLTHIFNSIFETKIYPEIWKTETLTPIPKSFPANTIKDLRPISGLMNFAKIFDRILAELMTEDMSKNRDCHQYGNEKGLFVNHYLVNLLHKTLTGVDKNDIQQKNAAI